MRRRPAGARSPRRCARCTTPRIFAQAVLHADRNAGEEKKRYQVRALELLRSSLEALKPGEERRRFWQETVAQDADLAPIQGSYGYRQLADSVR